jgi:2-oxoglutarate dehydrogenase E1 component
VRELYGQRLIDEGVITPGVDGWIAEFAAFLDAEFEAGKTYHADKADWLDGKWSGSPRPEGEERRGNTACRARSCATWA